MLRDRIAFASTESLSARAAEFWALFDAAEDECAAGDAIANAETFPGECRVIDDELDAREAAAKAVGSPFDAESCIDVEG